MTGGQFIREPITVIGPTDTPTPDQRQVYDATNATLKAAVQQIMLTSMADAVTAHTLLMQSIMLQLALLDADAASDFIDATRRNILAGVAGDSSGVALDEMVAAGERLAAAFELVTREDAGHG